MGAIRRELERADVSGRRLAERLGVSPATVQSPERSDAEGCIQIDRLGRALETLGVRLRVDATPRTPSRLACREERVAVELHKLVATHVLRDLESTLARVPSRHRAHASPGRPLNLKSARREV
jgi:transcriptional regulator with XRE-family HTH domain